MILIKKFIKKNIEYQIYKNYIISNFLKKYIKFNFWISILKFFIILKYIGNLFKKYIDNNL